MLEEPLDAHQTSRGWCRGKPAAMHRPSNRLYVPRAYLSSTALCTRGRTWRLRCRSCVPSWRVNEKSPSLGSSSSSAPPPLDNPPPPLPHPRPSSSSRYRCPDPRIQNYVLIIYTQAFPFLISQLFTETILSSHASSAAGGRRCGTVQGPRAQQAPPTSHPAPLPAPARCAVH